MSNGKNPFSRIRLVRRHSSPLLKCVVLAAIILSTVAILTLHFSIRQTQQETQLLRSHAARLEQENQDLATRTAQIGTVESIKRIAQEELGLVDPDAEFFEPIDSNP